MKIVMKKDIVAGLGEIGLPILKILSKKENIVGYDLNEKLMDEKKFNTSVFKHLSFRLHNNTSVFWYLRFDFKKNHYGCIDQ